MPRTLAQNATYINETIKPAIKSAIEAQGVTVPSTDSFLDYADRIGEIEGSGSGYQLKDLPTGSISTVTDAAPLPLNALKVSVEAWQEGSGDPSPSNVRPLHGWDSGEITVEGKSLLADKKYLSNSENVFVGADTSSDVEYYLKSGTYHFTITYAQGVDKRSKRINYSIRGGSPIYFNYGDTDVEITLQMDGYYQFWINSNNRMTVNDIASFALILPNTYTQQFPQTIYGAEWNVVDGGMDEGYGLEELEFRGTINSYSNITYGFIYKPNTAYDYNQYSTNIITSHYKTRTDSNDWDNSDKIGGIYGNANIVQYWVGFPKGTTLAEMNAQVDSKLQIRYRLKQASPIQLSPLSIRMLQGTNNIYANCGDVIEGEYFVDEGAIDVRKVDYQIGASGSIKTTDGRVLSGFASMNGYHARPLDASGNWLDVDWSKSFEIGVAFKMTEYPGSNASQYIFGNGTNDLGYRFRTPRVYFSDYWQSLLLDMSLDGNSWYMDASVNFKPALDIWYFIRLKFDLQTLRITLDITTDFETYTTLHTEVLSSGLYHNSSAIGIGGDQPTASDSTTDSFKVDTFNTYIKGDGVNWGASTSVFPS